MPPNHQSIQLEILPPEILYKIVDYLDDWELKDLSCVSKCMRDICLPSLFRKVSFEFSKDGFDALEELLQSHLCSYVASFQYVIPQLLKPEIRDYATFKTQILTPSSYVEECESWDDMKGLEEDDAEDLEDWDDLQLTARYHPSYTLVYRTLRRICLEQQRIIKTGRDLALLSLAFQRLPKLTELSLDFCEALVDVDWVKTYLALDMTMEEKSYEHHIQLVSTAMKSVKDRSVSIHTVQLVGLSFIYEDPWHIRDTRPLTALLAELLENASRLRLLGSHSALGIISHLKLKLHHLELCSTSVTRDSVETFLRTNINGMQSIAFHDVNLIEQNWVSNIQLAPADLRKMIDIWVTKTRGPSCRCSFHKGWKLYLDHACPFPALTAMKRKRYVQ